MKLKAYAASTAGLALIAGATLLGAAPAHAADIPVVVPNPIPSENPAGYDPFWFAGTVTGGDGTAVQDASGLVITGGTNGFQLLNGAAEDDPSITLNDALDYQAVSTAGGDAFYQISVFAEPDTDFTTLRPVVASETWGDWELSRDVAGLTAGAPYTKTEIITALDAGSPAQVLAFGVFVNAGDTVTLRGLVFNGDNYLFAQRPSIAVSPASIQLSERGTTVVTLTASGFAADEDVYIGVSTQNGGGLVDIVPADADGTISYVLDVTAEWEQGEYTFGVSDEGGVFFNQAVFSIVANALAATGLEVTGGIIGAGILLTAGAAFVVITLRRRAAAE